MGLELAQYISFWGIFRNASNSRNDVTKAQERNILLHDKQPLLTKEKADFCGHAPQALEIR